MNIYEKLVTSEQYLRCFAETTVLGVAGTNGAGKDVLMEYLERRGFLLYRTGEHLRQVSNAALGSPARGGNESPTGLIGNAQRRCYPGGMLELGLIDWWARVAHLPTELRPRGLVIGSLRSVGEAERLKTIGGTLVLVDADRQVRYERMNLRQRADEPGLSYEQFCHNEDAELAAGQTDPTKFAMAAVIEAADITIMNDSTIEVFYDRAHQQLSAAGIDIS